MVKLTIETNFTTIQKYKTFGETNEVPHIWKIKVNITGNINSNTGKIANFDEVMTFITESLPENYEYLYEYGDFIPTTENLAKYIYMSICVVNIIILLFLVNT